MQKLHNSSSSLKKTESALQIPQSGKINLDMVNAQTFDILHGTAAKHKTKTFHPVIYLYQNKTFINGPHNSL